MYMYMYISNLYPCFFSIHNCLDCICKLMFYKANSRPEVDCPKCHSITPVPERNVDKLPKNYGLIEVISSSTTPQHHTALADPPQLSGHESSYERVERPLCEVHKDHISSYCVEDSTLVCSSCLLFGEHKGHKCLMVSEAAGLERAKLRQLNPEVASQREKMQTTLEQVEDNLKKVEENGGR